MTKLAPVKVFKKYLWLFLAPITVTTNLTTSLDYETTYEIAKKHTSGKSGDSYYSAASLVKSLGGDSNGFNWQSNKSFQGKSLQMGITEAIENKALKPAMVVYINNSPGKDPSSTQIKYGPHWLVYIGKDHSGVDRFADQYFAGYPLEGENSLVSRLQRDKFNKVRLVDEILDPFPQRKVQADSQTEEIISGKTNTSDQGEAEEALRKALDQGTSPGFDNLIGNTNSSEGVLQTDTQDIHNNQKQPQQLTKAQSSSWNVSGSRQSRRNFEHSFRKVQGIAWNNASGLQEDSYRAISKTAQSLGARGNGWTWKSNKKYQNQSILRGILNSIKRGDLLPGMVIYTNNQPGSDPSSQKIQYQPHWFTYLGKDPYGEDRFADQYNADWGVTELSEEYVKDDYGKTRKLDEILDPFAIQ